MKIQSSLLVACTFLFSVVRAESYPATVEFDTPGNSTPYTIDSGTLHIEKLNKTVVFAFWSNLGYEKTHSKGFVKTDAPEKLAGRYFVSLNDDSETLQLVFENKDVNSEFQYSGSSATTYEIEGLEGVALAENGRK
ncbi:hypothetical protein DFQ28_002949 [Apophysomyces sp. BC1034]|nr:hypothetical protein DFQ30_009698 [Apophysomyces sp. BC1015]KAG0183605.1 hypothetical protein DFQ29_000030 [Apophysomyces sp. BC1021]KAG0183616.1 hypothetical protein DFQ29_000041 [Apophysomyces sp. BC1021]KAG0194874.1 hypothetical protein DFQ28_002949 [Apophysomyces sp. BC1034]